MNGNGAGTSTGLPDGPLPFPFPRTDVLRPLPLYSVLRRQRPVAPVVTATGVPALLVTRYADVRTVLEDARFSRVALSRTDPRELVAYTPPPTAAPADSEHSTPYELVNRWFTPRAVERLRRRTRQVAEELVDRVAAGTPPVDLVAELTAALPATVFGELAGIPEPDRDRLRELAPLVTADAPDEASRAASAAAHDYFRTALDARRGTGATDLLGQMVQAHERDPTALDPDRLVTLAMRACLPAFHSISVVLGKGLPILLRQPEVYAALACQPDLVAPVVEEILRLTTPSSTALPRLACSTVELSGIPVPAGSVVLASLESANTDEERYPDPERVIPGRGAPDHTTFGRGANFCLGAGLSRMECQVVLEVLARRLPGLRLAVPEEQLPVRTGVIAPDVVALPVAW